MATEALARWAGILLVVGGAVGFAGDAYHLYWTFSDLGERSDLLATLPYRAHGVLIGVGYGLGLAGLAGLILRWRERFPALGAAGAVVAFVGTPFVIGDYWAESVVTPAVVASTPTLADADATGGHLAAVIGAFALFALGWLLVAVAVARARLAPRPVAIGLAVAAVVAFTPLPGSNLLLFLMLAGLGRRAA